MNVSGIDGSEQNAIETGGARVNIRETIFSPLETWLLRAWAFPELLAPPPLLFLTLPSQLIHVYGIYLDGTKKTEI